MPLEKYQRVYGVIFVGARRKKSSSVNNEIGPKKKKNNSKNKMILIQQTLFSELSSAGEFG